MKRFISVALAALILSLSLFSSALCVSAAKDKTWVIGENAEYLTYQGKTYYPLNTHIYCVLDYENSIDINDRDIAFADDKTKEHYGGSYIYASADYSCAEVSLCSEDYDYYDDVLYVEESYMEEYEAVARGEAESYETDSYYGESFTIAKETFTEWTKGEKLTVNSRELQYWENYYLQSCGRGGFIAECGMIFRSEDTDDLYLLTYSEYDKTYFFSDGTFDLGIGEDITVYKLEDEVVRNKLITYYDTEYEDELDWLVPGGDDEYNDTLGVIVCSILFGVVPLLLIAFSVVMLCVIKDKKYHRAYITILIGSVLVLAASVAVIILSI